MGPTDFTLFSHSQTHPHAEAPQCRMHGSTEICLLRVPRIRRVVGRRVQTPRRGLIPRHRRQTFSLQITASTSPTSSAGSVMGQLSIGRLAKLSWILRLHTNHWNTDPKCSVWQKRPMHRACGNIHSCSVRSTSSAAAGTPQSAPFTHPSRGVVISATPASSRPHRHPAAPCHQCRRSHGASSQTSRQSSSPPPPTAPCHALQRFIIDNTSGTMPRRHREPTANAARGK
ncbi:regulator of sigma E protease [Trypanosoma cruzi]|nr:regulator of sigma E protease [Trypanosoma cruzi]